MSKDTEKLIAEVEALCAVYSDKDGGEQWGETLKRIDRLDKLVKKIRKAEGR
jgi:hypothetical protein